MPKAHRLILPLALLAATLFAASGAAAQAIERVQEPFMDRPALPFAPAGTRQLPRPVEQTPVQSGFLLRGGQPISAEITAWAARTGWEIYWHHRVSWKTIRDTVINRADVSEAVSEVIDILREEGKPIALRISAGNKVMEVLSLEVRNEAF